MKILAATAVLQTLTAGAVGLALTAGTARAAEIGYAATRGHADFVTEHLYPGAAIVMAPDKLNERIVALTFDDGPDPANDAALLRILKDHHAVATFFVIGEKARSHPEMLRAAVAQGNEVGNHSWDHPRLIERTPAQQADQVRRTNEAIAAALGTPARWFRPPFGSYDEHTLPIVRSNGLETIIWTVDSQDYRDWPPAKVEARVMAGLTPGAVVLMHSTHDNTVAALPAILTRMTAAGYRFVTMTQWKARMERAAAQASRR